MKESIIAAIRQAIDEGETEPLTRAVIAVLRASDYGHSVEETLSLLISAAIRNITPDRANVPFPEAIAGAVLNGMFLGRPGEFIAGQIAVNTRKDGESTIAVACHGTMPEDQDELRRSLLHHAAWAGDATAIKALADVAADPDARDGNGRTPLVCAAITQNLAAVDALIEVGADPNAACARGITALHYAAAGENVDFIAALIDAGADVNACSVRGQTPLDCADAAENLQALIALLDAGGLRNENPS